jgi:hypothetical protein
MEAAIKIVELSQEQGILFTPELQPLMQRPAYKHLQQGLPADAAAAMQAEAAHSALGPVAKRVSRFLR